MFRLSACFTAAIIFIFLINPIAQNTVSVNASENWTGYVNVFDLAGNYQFGSGWGVSDLQTTITPSLNTIELQPNFNTYADNPGDPYWQNGATGAKILDASTYVEPGASFNGVDLTFSGSVVSNTIDLNLYSAKYFIKALDPNNGYSDALGGSAMYDLPATGNFTAFVPAASLSTGLVIQYGFVIYGINANPADMTTLGSVIVTGATSNPSNYTELVWSDEFNVDGAVDPTKWYHQTILPNGVGWFNGELQHYTDRTDNSYVDNGSLYIVAKKENFTDQGQTKQYTSARLNSKFAFTNGRVEVRAKLPMGIGTWPAIWMLGKNINENGAYWQTQGFGTTNWPDCGEIDIMEHWGSNQNYVQSALHTPSSFGATVNHGGLLASNVSSTFHEYSMEWSEDEIVFSLDGVVYYTYSPPNQNMSTWPFVAEQFLLLNIAIEPSIDPNFSSSPMVIDYVRVYQEPTSTLIKDNYENNNFHVFPNPALDEITVTQISGEIILTKFLLLDISGKKVKSALINSDNFNINLSELPNGIYHLQLKTDNQTIKSFPVLKQ